MDAVDPDLIHTHGLWMYASLVAMRSAHRTKKPHIISPRGMLEPWAWKHNAWKKRPIWWAWERRNVTEATVLHATADTEAENLRVLGLRNPIAVIPNGVDLPADTAPIPHDGPRIVLFLSRIHPKKGLLNLVQAWDALRPKDWKLVIAGPSEGRHEDEVRAAVRQAWLNEQIEFVGPVYGQAKWDLYRRANLFVLPTFSENFGIVVAEALATGVPVITTTGTPWKDLRDHGCGWWIDVGVKPLMGSLRDAMALSDGARRAMGERGRRLVEAKYSWPEVAQQMHAVYSWALGNGPRPDCVRVD